MHSLHVNNKKSNQHTRNLSLYIISKRKDSGEPCFNFVLISIDIKRLRRKINNKYKKLTLSVLKIKARSPCQNLCAEISVSKLKQYRFTTKYLNRRDMYITRGDVEMEAEILKEGRLKWKRRKLAKRERGGPSLVLPPELKSWAGKTAEIELLSEKEIIVRLEE